MTVKEVKSVRPDSKGRISLAHGVSSYEIIVGNHNEIILKPRVEIPANEKWLFDNAEALQKVKCGLEDSAAGRIKHRGSFAKYADKKK